MKRSERKKIKSNPEQSHAEPQQNHAQNHDCHATGPINVSGVIEAKRPPELTEEHNTERKEDTTHEHKKYVVEVVTVIFVVIVAFLNSAQVYLGWNSGQIAKKQMIVSVRPWIGLDDSPRAITAGNLLFDATGQPHLAAYAISLKNYSPYPAQNVFQASFLILTRDLRDVDTAMKLACRTYVTNPDINYVVFQGQNRFIDGLIMTYPNSTRTGVVEAFIAGCIGYRDQFGVLYRSGFEFDFRPVGQPQGGIDVDLSKDMRNQSILGEWYLIYSNLDPGTEDKKTSNRQ